MPEVKNAFIKSKMNKDLDARLLPSGEYRNAMNAQVSKSEGSDVGALQNILGNTIVADFSSLTGVTCDPTVAPCLNTIGYLVNDFNSTIYLFLTDNNEPTLEYNPNSKNFIVSYDTLRNVKHLLVEGAFLNFSSKYPIFGVNILENLLFWTDNRNQPRKINVNTATTNPLYYTIEDQISVAKYNPYPSMELWRQRIAPETAPGTYETTMYDVFNKFYPNGGTALVNGTVTNQTIFPIDTIVGDIPVGSLVTGTGVVAGTTVVNYNTPVLNVELSDAQTLANDTELVFNANPYYEADFNGDTNFLKDKFVRFAYRFKFDDGEYSIFSTFTQPAFIPKQDGYFMYNQSDNPPVDVNDEENTYRSTIVDFMENKVSKVLLNIPLPFTKASIGTGAGNPTRVVSVDILYKESDALAVKVLDTIDISEIGNDTDGGGENNYVYNYQSKKPYKTLPSKDLIRVYDKIPVRAFSQEIISNRVVYGNFQNKHTPPKDIDYNLVVSPKDEFNLNINTADLNGAITASTTLEVDNVQSDVSIGFLMTGAGVTANTVVVLVNGTTVTVNQAQTLIDDTVLTFTPIGDDINTTSSIEYPNHSLKQNRNYQVGIVLSDRYGRQSTVVLSSTLNSVVIGALNFVGSTIYSPYRTTNDVDPSIWPGDSLKVLFNSVIGPSAPNYTTFEPGIYNGEIGSASYNPLGWYSYKIVVKQTEQEYYNAYLPGVLASYPSNTTLELGKTSFSVLINDNINKIPRDLSEVGPQQRQFRSSVRLFGRVENTLDSPQVSYVSNTQYYPGRTSSVVSTIAGNNDLFNGDNIPSYLPSSEFYQIESDPLISKISTTNQFGTTATLIQATSLVITNAAAIGFDTAIPLIGSPVVGCTVSGFGLEAGLTVSALTGVAPNVTGVIVSKNGTDQPVTLAAGTVLTFTPPNPSTSTQHLAVFETEPVSSLLDIFWETSTTGVISELNNFITNNSGGSSTLGNWATNNWCEDDAIGTFITDNAFFPVDNFGNAIAYTDIVSLQLTEVRNGQNQNVQLTPSYFTLIDNGDGTYNISINRVFVENADSLNLGTNDFVFYFKLTTLDALGASSENNFTEAASVCNKFPLFGGAGTFANLGECPATAITTTATNTNALYEFYGRNGSHESAAQIANGELYEDVAFELLQVLESDGVTVVPAGTAFVLGTSTSWNSVTGEPASVSIFRVSSFTTSGSYFVTMNVIDGVGAKTVCVFEIIISTPGCECRSFNCRIIGSGFTYYTACDGSAASVYCSETQASDGTIKNKCARGGADGTTCDPTTC